MALTEAQRLAIHQANVQVLGKLHSALQPKEGASLTTDEKGLLTSGKAFVPPNTRYNLSIQSATPPPSAELGRAFARELVCTSGDQELFRFGAVYRQAYPDRSSLTRVLRASDGRTLSYTFHQPALHATQGYVDATFSAPGQQPTVMHGVFHTNTGVVSLDLDVLKYFDESQLAWALPFAGPLQTYLQRLGVALPHGASPSAPTVVPFDLSVGVPQEWPFWVGVLVGIAGCALLGAKISKGYFPLGIAVGVICAVVLLSALNDWASDGGNLPSGSAGTGGPPAGPDGGTDAGGAPPSDSKQKDRTDQGG